MSAPVSLARGASLNAATWADFVERLRHDCEGDGVRDHCTANAIFIVQAKRFTYGIDPGFGDGEWVACFDDTVYTSAKDFYDNHLDDEGRSAINAKARAEREEDFLSLGHFDQWHFLIDEFEDVTVTCRAERWDYVSAHFTKDAAEAFIRRKGHDYRNGLRVYVDAQTYSWEFNMIKEAILSGSLVLAQGGAT